MTFAQPISKWLVRYISAALALLLLLPAVTGANERSYPFPRKQPVNVGSENFHPEYLSLQGLEGLYIDFDAATSGLLKIGHELDEDFKEKVQQILSDTGLELLNKDTVRWSPGQPVLNIWPTFESYGLPAPGENTGENAGETANITAVASPEATDILVDAAVSNNATGSSDAVAGGCSAGKCPVLPSCNSSLWMGFSQSASLLRQPLREYRLSTWGAGEKSTACENRAEWAKSSILKNIESFVDDYKQAQQEQMPALVSRATDLPRNCAQSWMMIDRVFELNESSITPKAVAVLEKYIEFTADCNGFGYVVEAHDDSHADNQYNQILRTARSEAVKEIINSLGIHFKRVKIRKKNEPVPFMSGTLDSALLKGSVIIYPQSPIEFTSLDLDF